MPTLTVEQSRNGARRSAEVRKSNAIELERLRTRVHELESALPAQPAPEPKPDPVANLARTREQLDALDKQLADCTDPKDWDCLTRSKERLFKQWVYLAGIPGPGNLKPTQSKQTQRRTWSEPTPVEPQPSSPAAGATDTKP